MTGNSSSVPTQELRDAVADRNRAPCQRDDHGCSAIDEAAAILDVLIDPHVDRRFIDNHRWTLDTYIRRLQTIATASILR